MKSIDQQPIQETQPPNPPAPSSPLEDKEVSFAFNSKSQMGDADT
jgi:hypothetical protein